MLMKKTQKLILITCLMLAGCTKFLMDTAEPRIVAKGDSLMAAHRISGRSISAAVADTLGEAVADRSVLEAQML